jgi:hypothetical protein
VGCVAAAWGDKPSRTGSRLKDQPDDTVIEHERAAAMETGREAGNAILARAVHVTGKPSMSLAADRGIWSILYEGSWLNMAEIEFSAMTKQRLDRRIGSMGELRKELQIWERRRNRERAKIRWRFTTDSARSKLGRHYSAVRN